jgi:hypothetical protein
MLHRHLNHDRLSLAAVDDIIERGKRDDWVRLARAVRADPDGELSSEILRLCASRRRKMDILPQAFAFWELYVRRGRL